MSRKRSRNRDLMTSAADTSREDGSDPKRFHDRRTWNPRTSSRKARQLCGQVTDAVRQTLDGLADEVLQNLTVISVEPAPHSGRLLVTVAVPATADVTDRDTARQRLNRACGLVRTRVASAVHRRKAPEIVFALV